MSSSITLLVLSSAALPGLSSWKLGLGELVAPLSRVTSAQDTLPLNIDELRGERRRPRFARIDAALRGQTYGN